MDTAKQESYETWNGLASGWERQQELINEGARHITEWVVDRLGDIEGKTVLDVAAGPGALSAAAATRVGPTGSVLCTDFAPAMVEVARRAVSAPNVEHRVLDAESMDLPDDSVDAVMSRFGFMLMPGQEAAFRETRRVLRPDGRFALAVWGPPDRNPWVTTIAFLLVVKGAMTMADPAAAGGMFSLADPERLRTMLTGGGFEVLEVAELDVVMRHAGLDRLWEHMSDVAGPVAKAISTMTPEETAEVKTELGAALEPYRDGDGYAIPGLALAAHAR
jgi:ubiquinone/menaquinone biosynthesis C-methylase UbiE